MKSACKFVQRTERDDLLEDALIAGAAGAVGAIAGFVAGAVAMLALIAWCVS